MTNMVRTRPARISRKIFPPDSTVPATADWWCLRNVEQALGKLGQARPAQVERRPGQPPLQIAGGVADVADQPLVIGRGPGGGQGGHAGQYHEGGEHGAPGRRQGGQAEPPQPAG